MFKYITNEYSKRIGERPKQGSNPTRPLVKKSRIEMLTLSIQSLSYNKFDYAS